MSTLIYTSNYRRNLKLYWRQYFPDWNIPIGFHVHHIKPKCTFEDQYDPAIHHPNNLIALHPDDHISIHKCRGDTVTEKFIGIGGHKHTEETKLKISNAGKGKKRSANTKLKISKAKQGQNNPMYGTTQSKETINKRIKSRKGYTHSEETKNKIGKKHKGKIVSEETKAKIRKARAKQVMKPRSEETKRKMSEAAKKREALKRLNTT